MIYFIAFLILLFLPKNKLWATAIFILLLGSISALRYNVGYDYENYMALIIGEADEHSFARLEWTSKLLMEFSRSLECPQIYFIITSLLIICPFAYIFYKESEDFCLSALLFYSLPIFFLSSLSLVRQSVACSFVFLMIYHCVKGNKILALVFWLISCQFHITAFFCLIIPLIYVKIWSHKLCVIMWIVSIIAGIYGIAVVTSVISIIPAGDGALVNKIYNFVLNPEYLSLRGYKGIQILFNLIVAGILPFYKTICYRSEEYKYYFHVIIMGVCVLNLFSSFGVSGGRMSIFFLSPLLLILPLLPQITGFNKVCLKTILVFFSFFLLSYTLYLSYSGFQNGVTEKDSYFPYKTFFAQNE